MVAAGVDGDSNCENKASWKVGLPSASMLTSLLALSFWPSENYGLTSSTQGCWGHLQSPAYTISSFRGLTV